MKMMIIDVRLELEDALVEQAEPLLEPLACHPARLEELLGDLVATVRRRDELVRELRAARPDRRDFLGGQRKGWGRDGDPLAADDDIRRRGLGGLGGL
jgi:hypothetical protein